MTDTPAATEAAVAPAADATANPTAAPAPAGASATAAATPAPAVPSDNTTSGTSVSTNADGATEVKTPESQPSLLEAAETKKPEAKPEAKSESKESKAEDKKSEAKDAPPPAEAAKDAKPEADKAPDAAKEATAEAPPAPVKYDAFKLPDGIKLDDNSLGKYTDILGASQVKQEDAQRLVDLYVSELREAHAAAARFQRETWDKFNNQWKDEARKEFGNHIDTTLKTAKAVIEEYGGTADQQAKLFAHMNTNGMGNYPGVIRLLANIGKALNVYEDSSVPANPTAPKMPKGNPGSGKTGWYKETMGNGATAP